MQCFSAKKNRYPISTSPNQSQGDCIAIACTHLVDFNYIHVFNKKNCIHVTDENTLHGHLSFHRNNSPETNWKPPRATKL